MTKHLCLAALAASLLVSVGCARRHVIHHTPRRTTVVHVRHAPPARPNVRVVRVKSPSARHVWVSGHHILRGEKYIWVKGQWTVPPRRGAIWVPGHFDRKRGVWVRGHWV